MAEVEGKPKSRSVMRYRPHTVLREVMVLSHAEPAGLAELINQQLARSVEPRWSSKGPPEVMSGVGIEPCSRLAICAPSNVYAAALEIIHWEMWPKRVHKVESHTVAVRNP